MVILFGAKLLLKVLFYLISFLSKIFELLFWVILLFKVLFWVKLLFWEIFWGLFWANLLFWGLFWVTFLESDACLSTFTFLRTFKSPFFCQLLFWGLLKVLFFLLFPTQNLYGDHTSMFIRLGNHLFPRVLDFTYLFWAIHSKEFFPRKISFRKKNCFYNT